MVRATIVIATWQPQRDHFQAALASARAQTCRDVEIVVSDDSPDDSLRAVVEAERDERIVYRHNHPSLGVAANHWTALRASRAPYLAILNHDDRLEPTFVECLAGALDGEPAAVLAFCDHWIIDTHGRRLEAATERNTVRWGRAGLAVGLHRPCFDLVVAQALPMAMGALFRRSALPDDLPAHAGPAYDLWLSHLLCRRGGGAWYEPQRLSAWRAHGGNLTSVAGIDWLGGAGACWREVARVAPSPALRTRARRLAASSHGSCAIRAWRAGHRRACLRYALASLHDAPTWRGLAALLLGAWPRRPA